jgi:hypothetical protein
MTAPTRSSTATPTPSSQPTERVAATGTAETGATGCGAAYPNRTGSGVAGVDDGAGVKK